MIKIKTEKSADLIRQHSLLCKILALKADDRGTDPEALVREIYRAAADMKDRLTEEHLLLLEQWGNVYTKISAQTLRHIKEETRIDMIEMTISEHIFHQGMKKGIAEGKVEGEAKGNIEGQIRMLDMLYQLGLLTEDQFHTMERPLRQKLNEFTTSA